MREDITVRNYGQEPAYCSLELLVDADFADLFEVKEGRVEKLGDLRRATSASADSRGTYRARCVAGARTLDFSRAAALSHEHARVRGRSCPPAASGRPACSSRR